MSFDFEEGEPRPRRRSSRRSEFEEEASDPAGVVSLIFGTLSVLGTVAACCTVGISLALSIPLACCGFVLAFFARGNMKTAGMTLNILALLPALVLGALFLLGIAGSIANTPGIDAKKGSGFPVKAPARRGG